MELLMILVVIPLIPFYILSVIFSGWVFILGIPFVVVYGAVAFIKGLIEAIFSRKVIPTLEEWREKLQHVQATGKWSFDDDNQPPRNHPDSSTNGRNPRLSPDKGGLNGRNTVQFEASSSLAPPEIDNGHGFVAHATLMAVSIVLNVIEKALFWTFHLTGKQEENALDTQEDVLETTASPRFDFFQELADEALNTSNDQFLEELAGLAHDSPRQDSRPVFQERSSRLSSILQPEAFAAPPSEVSNLDYLLADLASAASFDEKSQSLLSGVPSQYKSALDELAEVSELATNPNKNLSFFEEIARSIPREQTTTYKPRKTESIYSRGSYRSRNRNHGRPPPHPQSKIQVNHDISPLDSASQIGSDRRSPILSDDDYPVDNGDTTDAAKMLFMFGAAAQGLPSSPQKNAPSFPKKSISPVKSKAYFIPGLVIL